MLSGNEICAGNSAALFPQLRNFLFPYEVFMNATTLARSATLSFGTTTSLTHRPIRWKRACGTAEKRLGETGTLRACQQFRYRRETAKMHLWRYIRYKRPRVRDRQSIALGKRG